MTKIDIFSGFLGAGKTTLIKKLIAEAYAGEKLVLIENEFGEIGIDGGFMREAGIEITEMNSGCICCSLVGDFGRALGEVLNTYHPDRILIEPSGVGKLSDVIRAVEGVTGEDAVLGSYVTVVDAGKCKMYMKNFGEFFGDQIKHAGCIVLSHTDRTSEARLAECLDILRRENPEVTIVTTPWSEMDGKTILAAMEKTSSLAGEMATLEEEAHHHHNHHHHHDHDHAHGEACTCGCHEHDHHHDHDHAHGEECACGCHEHDHHHDHDHAHGEACTCGCHDHDHHHDHDHAHGEACTCGCHDHDHHHHHADDVFESWGIETAKKFTEQELRAALEAFDEDPSVYGIILRAKGIVPASDGAWIHFDFVPEEIDIRRGAPEVTGRLCVIGSGIDREAIARALGV